MECVGTHASQRTGLACNAAMRPRSSRTRRRVGRACNPRGVHGDERHDGASPTRRDAPWPAYLKLHPRILERVTCRGKRLALVESLALQARDGALRLQDIGSRHPRGRVLRHIGCRQQQGVERHGRSGVQRLVVDA